VKHTHNLVYNERQEKQHTRPNRKLGSKEKRKMKKSKNRKERARKRQEE